LRINKLRKSNKDKNIDRRLEVLVLRANGEKRDDIATKTGYSAQYITELVSEYKKTGLEYFAQKHHKGNHRNMSVAEEEVLLSPFKKADSEGKIVEVSEILAAYESKLGRPVASNSQIYNVLKRHGWRKVMPRSKHPNKASDEAIDASKKLTIESKN